MSIAVKMTILFLSLVSAISLADRLEECAKLGRWAPSMAQVHLKNAGLLKNHEIDFSKTEVNLLASEQTKKNLYHQIQKVIFTKKNGGKIIAITETDSSKEECSEGDVKVYLVEKELGP